MLGHELVELDLIPSKTQPVEKRHEFTLLFFEPAQRLGAVFVKRPIAARMLSRAAAPSPRGRLHSLHPPLHSFHATLPAIPVAVCPTCHSPTPHPKSEKQEAKRPKQSRMMMHDRRPDVNVCHINIGTCSPAVKKRPRDSTIALLPGLNRFGIVEQAVIDSEPPVFGLNKNVSKAVVPQHLVSQIRRAGMERLQRDLFS